MTCRSRVRVALLLLFATLIPCAVFAEDGCVDLADEALFEAESWEDLGKWIEAYPECDDGYFAEHISEIVTLWLSRSPRELSLLAEAVDRHAPLEQLVLRHIDLLASEERTITIRRYASKQCPDEARALCAGLIAALDRLEAEVRRERKAKD